ncbi:glutamate ABC transporter substrate-binding protein [Streptomyces sp. 6N223]|uniref:glutamate ABC transporter substrate-binding protein n=1 Tax=Streptomyces sp. 6N223 TaxID=3457412 RepID=UPI003FD49FDE
MSTSRSAAEEAAVAGPGGPARGRRGGAWALLVAAGGLTLAGAMLVASLPSSGGDGRPGPAGGGLPHAERAANPGQEDPDVGGVAEPEVCPDGINEDLNAATSYGPGFDGGDAVERIQDAGRLVVGVDQNSYRWGYREPSGTDVVGFDIDLVEAIAESLLGDNPTIIYKAIPTAERENAIRDGDVDMVVRTMSITCERWDKVAFSAAYFETGQQLLAPRDSRITGVDESLSGHTVCSGEETTASDQLQARTQSIPDVELIHRGSHLDCLVAIQLGQADALMTDSALAAGHAAQDPTMHLVGEPVTVESYGVAMNLADVDLVRWVNGVLEDYTASGAWDAAYEEWLAEYMGEGVSPPEPLYRD